MRQPYWQTPAVAVVASYLKVRFRFVTSSRRSRSGLTSAALFVTLFVGMSVGAAGATGRPVPRFEPSACPKLAVEVVPAIKRARCGFLVVPENRARPGGRTIRLAVATVPAMSRTPASDPVVYLDGGPGGTGVASLQSLIDTGVNRDRALIAIGQRGTLFSKPALACPEVDRFLARSAGLVYDAASTGRLHVAATLACRRRLASRGIDLGAYNTTENAADIADLRTALGIAGWNLYGVSYGTDLALTVMREHPQGIRSVTLDSPVPSNVVNVAGLWPNAREGFDNLFRACRAQPACRRRHPRLAQTFARLVRRLEAHPLTARVQPAAGKPAVKVVLDGGALVNWLVIVVLTNSDSAIRSVPAAIGDLAAGHPQAIAAARAAFTTLGGIGLVGYGLQYGVACSEWIRPASDVLRQGRRAFPGYPDSVVAQAPQLPFINGDCRAWDVPKAPSTARAVTHSSIPTLVMAGTFDAATPPSQGKVATRTLPNSTLVTIPGSGHQVILASSCARRVLASFLASPAAPNTRCVAGLRPPTFAASPRIAAAEGLEPPTPGS